MPRPSVDHAPLADRSSGQYEIGPAVCCWALIQRVAATGQDVHVVTVDDVRAVLARLPRSSEVLVRERYSARQPRATSRVGPGSNHARVLMSNIGPARRW